MNASSQPSGPSTGQPTPYEQARSLVRRGGDASAEAARLVGAMTLEEKLGCLDGDTDFWPGLIDMVSGGYYRAPFAAAAVQRLGFPGLRFSDGPRGIVVGASTCFPVPMARGATFDPELEERIGEAIGIETRIQGADFFGGVCVNLLRHPGWGRAQETYGEDPFHVGEMGAALTRGVQRHAMACVKHFACNSIENARFQVDVQADPEVLDDVYLPHFRRVVDEGVASVMTAYNSLNGHWCGQSRPLLEDTLRRRWGFDGFVISDFVYGLRDPVASVQAGLDIEMPFRQQRAASLAAAIDDGRLAIEDVDACVRRIVATVLRFDAATPDQAPDSGRLAGPDHRALARRAAAESVVLLRNEVAPFEAGAAPDPGQAGQPLLPIDRDFRGRIALLGRLADAENLGDHGSSNVHPPSVVTIEQGLRQALPGAEWVDDAARADLAIVVAGYTFEDEGEFTGGMAPELLALMPEATDDSVWSRLAEAQGEGKGMALGGDRRSLRLREEDEQLIAATATVQPRTIVLVVAGSAVVVEPWIESVAAVLHVWYPGMEGGHAIADVLTGVVDPGGRLPFAVPRDESHLPPFDPDAREAVYDAWHGQWLLDRDGNTARFPFGFGLSYTTFELRAARRDTGRAVVDVVNRGERDGACVVFAFVEHGPSWRLIDFRKVRVPASSTVQLALSLPRQDTVRLALQAGDPGAIDLPVETGSTPR